MSAVQRSYLGQWEKTIRSALGWSAAKVAFVATVVASASACTSLGGSSLGGKFDENMD